MLKRLLLAGLLAVIPITALADDTVPVDVPAAAATPTTAPASGDSLGPGTSSPAGGSSADVGSLQPAGGSPLQSTTNDSSGLTAPNQQTLQQPASGDSALQVLRDEADGSPQPTKTGSVSYWAWLAFLVLFGLIAAAGYWFVIRPRRHRDRQPNPFTPSTADPEPVAPRAASPESTNPEAANPESDGEPAEQPATPDSETATAQETATLAEPATPEPVAAEPSAPTPDTTPTPAAPAPTTTPDPKPSRRHKHKRRHR
jgi:hypothetical protein